MPDEQTQTQETAKRYFGSREIKEASNPAGVDAEGNEIKSKEVLVEYADGLNPVFEAMSQEEFDAGVSDKPCGSPQALQENFVKRTLPLRQAVHSVFEAFNPRFEEIGKILDWIMEAYQQAYAKIVDLEYGQPLRDSKISDVFAFLEKNGLKWREGMDACTLALLDFLAGEGMTAQELVGRQTVAFLSATPERKEAFGKALESWELSKADAFDRSLVKDAEDCGQVMLQKVIDLAIAVPQPSLRTNNLQDIFDLHKDGAKPAEEAKPVETETK